METVEEKEIKKHQMETVEEKEIKKQWKKPWSSLFKVINISHPWDVLPSLALLNIFKKLNFKDRFGSIPLVCKSWNSIISNDPRCWSSMIPDSISPDDAFVKKPDYSFDIDPRKYYKLYNCDEVVRVTGASYLHNLIKKSSSGASSSSSTITSLCLDRFHFSYLKINVTHPWFHISHSNVTPHQDEMLHLIAHCCPNLKHISFDGFYCASIEAVLEVFKRCNKIELIDFSDSGYADSVQVIEVLGKCLPNLRGIRMAGWKKNYSIHDAIATHLPRIKLLVVDYRSSNDEDFRKLTSETKCCLYELQYLSVGLWKINPHTLPVCTHIPEFHYEKLLGCGCRFMDNDRFKPLRSVHQPKDRPRLVKFKQVCYDCRQKKQEDEYRAIEEAKEVNSDCSEKYFGFYYEDYSVMKQMKKYEYDVYISKEKNKRKKTRRNDSYLVLRTRMRKNKIMMNCCYSSFNTYEN